MAFKWNTRRERAAVLVAEDRISDVQIAAEIGVTKTTLENWKLRPEFQTRVASLVAAYREQIQADGIANRQNRVDALNDRWRRMQQVIQERSADEQMEGVPGGQTGLLVHQVKGIGKGEDFQLIDLYAVDVALLRELREHEKQAAQELGQWTEKSEQSVTVTGGIEVIEVHKSGDISRAAEPDPETWEPVEI